MGRSGAEGKSLLFSDGSAQNNFLMDTNGSERRLDDSENNGHWSNMLVLGLSARSFDQNTEKTWHFFGRISGHVLAKWPLACALTEMIGRSY